jgi:hypothetical protein
VGKGAADGEGVGVGVGDGDSEGVGVGVGVGDGDSQPSLQQPSLQHPSQSLFFALFFESTELFLTDADPADAGLGCICTSTSQTEAVNAADTKKLRMNAFIVSVRTACRWDRCRHRSAV